MAKLYSLLKADEKQARRMALKELKENGYSPVVTDDFIYAEGTVPVLLVAHYDTVPKPPKFIKNDNGILSARHGLGADDRAGMFAIFETIKKHHCFVLFTGGEEQGCVGARAFTQSGIMPEVNYIIEIDRRGTNDAVFYDCDNEDFEKYITDHGWATAFGTFTDICEVAPYIGVAAVNLSIGYQNEHRKNETLDTEAMNKTIARLPELFDGPKFEYIEAVRNWGYYNSRGWFDYDSYYDWGTYSSTSKNDREWLVEYEPDSKADDTELEFVKAVNYDAAIGAFLIAHPDLSYNNIIDCFSEEELEEDYTWQKTA